MKNQKPIEKKVQFSYIHRELDLMKQGLSFYTASRQAYLEQQIAHWSEEWDDKLEFLIYGDFQPPNQKLVIKPLGIIVYPEIQEHFLFKPPITVLRAMIKVSEKSIDGVIDATKRINILLGTHTLVEWGNEAVGWWSQITHYPVRTGFGRPFDVHPMTPVVESFLLLPNDVQKKVQSAMFWIYAPKHLWTDVGVNDSVLRIYTSYWNAFECLVDAILLLHPIPKISKIEKEKRIDKFIADSGGKLTAQNLETCYWTIVNPGLVKRTEHAFNICFGQDAERYVKECFKSKDPQNSLYKIRNSINHGDINACDPFELARVQEARGRLWFIVWRLFGRFLQFNIPDDKDGKFGVPLDEYTFKQHRD